MKKRNETESRPAYLSSLSRQCTSIGRIPDLIRSSMGGLRSLDNNFLQEQRGNKRPLQTYQKEEPMTHTVKQLKNVNRLQNQSQ